MVNEYFELGQVMTNEKIEEIISCLQEAWQDLDLTGEKPVMSLELLNQDVERLKGNL